MKKKPMRVRVLSRGSSGSQWDLGAGVTITEWHGWAEEILQPEEPKKDPEPKPE